MLVWHLDKDALPGGFVGVDVFFVISGYLMTRWLVERPRLDRATLVDFWSRRSRRILPAATLVLVATLAVGWAVLPATRRTELAGDALWSALYAVNLRFAQGSTDYLQSFEPPSPFQHYWSLAVEEQFYLLWPFLMAAAAVLAVRLGRSRRLTSGAIIVTVIVVSAALSVWWTVASPASAYFVTPTRLWELALGGLVAVLPALAIRGAGWIAAAALAVALASFPLLDSSVPFPGTIAWWPTLATAVVLWAGSADSEGLVHRLLGSRAVQWMGAVSYSVYLWHWPLIVLSNPYDKPVELLSWRSLLLVLATLALAWLTYRFVEEPLRKRSPRLPWATVRGGLLLGATCLAVTLMVAGSMRVIAPANAHVPDYPGPAAVSAGAAAVPEDGTADAVADLERDGYVPAPDELQADLPATYAEGCHVEGSVVEAVACSWGDAGPLVVVVGDSHATQWVPTVQELAQQHGWRVMAMTKAGCPFTDAPVAMYGIAAPYSACTHWNEAVAQVLEEQQPALVLTSNAPTQMWNGTVLEGPAADAALGRGMADAWGAVLDRGGQVVVMRDTPSARFAIEDCVANEPDSPQACSFDRAAGLAGGGTGQTAGLELEPRALEVDLNDAICGETRCPAIVAGVQVYRDRGHLTGSYARSLAEPLERAMAEGGALPLR
ncbi:Peptidoglycan/LPS O-acetylase OafA/YrhL, contains acyltransferase and SGNH-hydrolase domains [Agrococcus baldri]|uniref:Peptidoglycan/LPS O-acetylase OafA/YrhL, contains acyltransferase and SGNH-hydrolase domains n=1 Tax=Agrococcus baldri TaxID=153730 RepID=A0AA94L012_9MICO|nr:Peptidoglycan/LPS O-acetylase OafA/YrhL, contains acyltransferase and SGNH-hydrolase domains [Agrococcus baldri]